MKGKLFLALLRSSILCIRGTRSTVGDAETQANLLVVAKSDIILWNAESARIVDFAIDFVIGFVIDFVMKIDLGIDFGIDFLAKIDFGIDF